MRGNAGGLLSEAARMRLVSIPPDKYDDYRLAVIFGCYKWDPQFLDNNTIAKHVLIISEEEHLELEGLTEALDRETMQAEEMLNNHLKLAKPLALPKKIKKELKKMQNYQAGKHIRLMRYDFHPTIEGDWAVSEVNSDVPGGFAEASLMPLAAADLYKTQDYWHKDFGGILTSAIAQKTKAGGKIMLVHCTSYSDDRQVMQFLGDKLRGMGFNSIYAAADHLRFENNEAISVLDGNEGKIDAIVRFTPLEWLVDMKPKRWQGYFDTITPSCNHPIAMFAQTKRFPLVWDALESLGANLSTWRSLLPDTLEVKAARNKTGYIYKPACGRVGEGISIKEACKDDEYEKIIKDVKRHPKKYLAQKRFNSRPLVSDEGEHFHVCLGSFSVEGQAAGYYARLSRNPRIDSSAADIPVLIEGRKDDR
jgi:glutathionylspermidine synthase